MNPKTLWLVVGVIIVIILGVSLMKAGKNDDMATSTDNITTESSQSTGSIPTNLPDGTYTLDTEESTMVWIGRKPKVLGYEDTGTIDLKSGTLTVAGGAIASGDFLVDMTTITGVKTSNTKAPVDKLSTHLKSDDFFAVETYPTAHFVLRSAVDGMVTGDLTIKNTTHSISFPATVVAEGATRLVADAAIVVDRSKWDVRYGSGSFFDDLGDSIIADEMWLTIHLVAEK